MTAKFLPVDDTDRDALVDFLFAHAPIMMFPLTNLTRFGLGGGNPKSLSAWVVKANDVITDVIAISQEGVVFPCSPHGLWEAAADVVRDKRIKGFLGEGQQVAGVRGALGLTHQAELDATEPAFVLNLADMRTPDTTGLRLRPLTAAPGKLMAAWRRDYEVETMQIPPAVAERRAQVQIHSYISEDTHRVLFDGSTPVAMTGFNAVLPEIVQVGGVYTPPDQRCRGYARAALALHLAEVAIDGVTEAVLSAANAPAARAYTALGFEQTGTFALVIYDTLQVPHG